MFNNKPALCPPVVAASALVIVCLLVVFGGRGQARQGVQQTAEILRPGAPSPGRTFRQPTAKEFDDAATPVVDLDGPQAAPADAGRAAKNARRDGDGFLLSKLDRKVTDVSLSRHRRPELAEAPAAESDLVVEGKVTGAAAYLSGDRGAVYSEFTLRVTDVLKVAPGLAAAPGDTLVAERLGGRVRYPNGMVVRYAVAGDGSPATGKKYLFFLSAAEGGGYELVTAYEMRGGVVRALDAPRGGRVAADGDGPEGAGERDYQEFKDAVKRAVRNSPGAARGRRLFGS
jgi:hypothetical protein